MKLEIQSRHFDLTKALEAHIKRKLEYAFSRIQQHVMGITIYLSDINGPKGGCDKQCRLQISLAKKEVVVIKDMQTDLYDAIDRAIQRAGRTVTRNIAKQQQLQRRISKAQVFEMQDSNQPLLN